MMLCSSVPAHEEQESRKESRQKAEAKQKIAYSNPAPLALHYSEAIRLLQQGSRKPKKNIIDGKAGEPRDGGRTEGESGRAKWPSMVRINWVYGQI